MTTKNKNDTMFRELSFERASVNDVNRTVELSFSSETPYKRWFGTEILGHKSENIDLTRLSEIGVLLFNHNSDKPIGCVESVELDEEERKCKATVRFDNDEESEKIYQKVLSGTLKGVSVGYRVSVWEEVESGAMSVDGRFAGPCSIAAKWMPYEISIVSVPADASVGVGRSENLEIQEEKGDEKLMGEENKNTNQIDLENERKKAIEVERQRSFEIMAMCRRFELEPDEYL